MRQDRRLVQHLRPVEVPEVLLPSSGLYFNLSHGILRVCSSRQECVTP